MTGAEQRTLIWGRAAVVALVLAAAVLCAVLLQRPWAFIDLYVYQWAAVEAFTPSNLYEAAQPGTQLRFTYTPFAALVFRMLDEAHLLGPIAFTTLSVLCLLRSCWVLAAHRGVLLIRWSRGWVALGLAAATLLMEPGNGTVLLGQINMLLLWLVVEGMLGPLRHRALGGVGVGLATGIKLTPGIYLVLLAITARWRELIVGAATVAATIALGWLLLPADSRAFWTGAGTDATRVGALEYAPNQSLNGVLWRVLGPGGSDLWWLVLGALIAGCSLYLARRFDRAGEHATAIGLAALAGLVVSPVSWTHHWVMLLPLVVGLLGITHRRWPVVGLTLAVCMVFGSRVVWDVPQIDGREFHHTPLQLVISSSYLLCAIALLVAAWLGRPRLDER